MVISLKRGGNDLHMVQVMPLLPHHPCFNKIQNCLFFWYWLTQVVPDKGTQNGSSSSSSSSSSGMCPSVHVCQSFRGCPPWYTTAVLVSCTSTTHCCIRFSCWCCVDNWCSVLVNMQSICCNRWMQMTGTVMLCALCMTVVHNDTHTNVGSCYNSLDWVLSCRVHFTVHRFICVYLCIVCFLFSTAYML